MTISLSNAFPLSGFVAFGTRKGLLRYGICVPCSKRLPTVRDAFSEALRAQNRLFRYGMNYTLKVGYKINYYERV